MPKKGLDDLMGEAAREGIHALTTENPRFRNQEDYIGRHVSGRKLKGFAEYAQAYIHEREKAGKPLSPDQQARLLYDTVKKGVASGQALDKEGQEIILGKSLEGKVSKNMLANFFSKNREANKNLNNVMGAFKELYMMLKTGDYAQRMPELYAAVEVIDRNNFLNTAVDFLAQYGLIDKSKYKLIKKAVKERTDQAVKYTGDIMLGYATGAVDRQRAEQQKAEQHKYRKVAAGFTAIIGVAAIVISGRKLTGNVIGNSNINILGVVAGLLIIAAAWLLIKKKRNKLTKKKK